MSETLTLAELERYDPHPTRRGKEQRFYCPVCGDSSDRRAWNRCLSVNTDTGEWFCHRCDAKGTLKEHWKPLSPRERKRALARRAFDLPPLPEAEPDPEKFANLQAQLDQARPVPLHGTPGETYLVGRGIPVEVAYTAGVRFSANWAGRPAVLFPMREERGKLRAVNGRYCDGKAHTPQTPKTRTYGPRKDAVFAGPGDWEREPVVIVEGPMCVLTLALLDIPAVAPVATDFPDWAVRKCAFKRVFVGFDADENGVGDTKAEKLMVRLQSLGAKPERLRPVGAKDFNDILREQGRDALRAALAPVLEAQKLASIDANLPEKTTAIEVVSEHSEAPTLPQTAPNPPAPIETLSDPARPVLPLPATDLEEFWREAERNAGLAPVRNEEEYAALVTWLEAARTDPEPGCCWPLIWKAGEFVAAGCTPKALEELMGERLARSPRVQSLAAWLRRAAPGDPLRANSDAGWFLSLPVDTLPVEPFALAPGRTIKDPAKFFAVLRRDLQRGPDAPRARYGAIQNDLQRLRARLTEPNPN